MLSCVSDPKPCRGPLEPPRLHAEQRRSLEYVHFRGGTSPAAPSAEERAAHSALLEGADPEEAELLDACYGEEEDLLVYAMRDSDGDGIHDYRVSDAFGKLHEGDRDLDGDGTVNVLDGDPHDAARGGADSNGNGVPDAVDWSSSGREAGAQLQQELAARYGILLVDRSAGFEETLARSTYDVLERVYRLPLAGDVGLAALAVVATEEVCLLTEEVDDGTHGVFVPQSRSLTLYRAGLDASPFVQLGLLAHELGHAYQYSLDFDFDDLAAENVRFQYPAPTFYAEVAAFGWIADPLAAADVPLPRRLYTDHYFGVEPSYRYRGRSPEAWVQWLAELYDEQGDGYLEDERIVAAGIVGDYSLENPWEWYSDNLIAYLFMEMEDAIAADPSLGEVRDALVARMRAESREAWPAFRYENVAPEVRAHMRQRFPITPHDLAYLVDTYVVAAVAGESILP